MKFLVIRDFEVGGQHYEAGNSHSVELNTAVDLDDFVDHGYIALLHTVALNHVHLQVQDSVLSMASGGLSP